MVSMFSVCSPMIRGAHLNIYGCALVPARAKGEEQRAVRICLNNNGMFSLHIFPPVSTCFYPLLLQLFNVSIWSHSFTHRHRRGPVVVVVLAVLMLFLFPALPIYFFLSAWLGIPLCLVVVVVVVVVSTSEQTTQTWTGQHYYHHFAHYAICPLCTIINGSSAAMYYCCCRCEVALQYN